MSEMIKRVVDAMVDADHGSEPGLSNYEAMARAAIEAMREPTNEMHKAMCECYNSPVCIWMTGINSALKVTEPAE